MSAIDQLISGYHRFRNGYYQENRQQLDALAREGQSPKVAVVACCDSRVDPAVITDSTPGDIFVIRNVANLVPPYEAEGAWHGTSAALQFAVCGLQVEHLIILGHAKCGGIRALMEGQEPGHEDKFISSWMSIVDDARQQAQADSSLHSFEDKVAACERGSIGISLNNLLTFSWIRERVEAGTLHLHGWYYDVASGKVLQLHPGSGEFTELPE